MMQISRYFSFGTLTNWFFLSLYFTSNLAKELDFRTRFREKHKTFR